LVKRVAKRVPHLRIVITLLSHLIVLVRLALIDMMREVSPRRSVVRLVKIMDDGLSGRYRLSLVVLKRLPTS
jgi:hypothetical protein